MKKLFIFDFDGTLFNSVDDVIICFNRTLNYYGFPLLSRDEYIGCLGGNIDDIVSLVLKENNSPENVEMFKRTYLDYYDESEKENTLPFPKAHELLKNLQNNGILLAVNSNRLTYSLDYFVNRFFSDIDFVMVEGHNSKDPSKPHPCGVLKIIEKAGVLKEETIYIGDSSTDILTAKNAGIDCVIVRWGYGNRKDWEDDYPVKVVDEMEELLELGG